MSRFYIPYILNKYTQRDIINIFKYADIGDVEHVRLYKSRPGSYYNSAIIYMVGIYKTNIGKKIYDDVLLDNKSYIFFPELNNRDISWLLMKQNAYECENTDSKNKYILLEDRIKEQQEEIRELHNIINNSVYIYKN